MYYFWYFRILTGGTLGSRLKLKITSIDSFLPLFLQRCGRLDDQISLLKHKLFLIQQGLAFNGKRTKTARSQGKKFQVSVEQEATRLLVRMHMPPLV